MLKSFRNDYELSIQHLQQIDQSQDDKELQPIVTELTPLTFHATDSNETSMLRIEVRRLERELRRIEQCTKTLVMIRAL